MKKLAFANNGLFFLVSGIGFAFLVITRRAINNKNISTLNTTFFILSGFMLLFLAIAFFSIRRTMRARIKTEEQLTIFKSVINSSDDFIVCKNMSSVIISWNPGAESIFGYTAHEILGQPFSLLIVPSRKAEETAIVDKVRNGNYVNKHETQWKHKDGGLVDVAVIVSPICAQDGTIIGDCSIGQNITANKKLQGDLAYKTQQARDILDLINDGVIILDEEFRIIYLNKKYSELMQRGADTLLNKCVWSEFPDAVGTATYNSICKAMSERKYFCTIDYFSALDLWHENHVYPTKDGVFVFVRDITEHKRAEEKIRISEKIYKSIASNIPDSVICLIDLDLRYTLIEGDMIERLGYRKNILLNARLADVLSPERFDELLPNLEKALKGEVSVTADQERGIDMLMKFVPLKDDNSTVISIMIVVTDVSELQKANRKISAMNNELEQKVVERTHQLANLNRELEAFSYSVAHDLRTPLRAVAGYATMLMEDYGSKVDEEGKRLLGQVDQNARKMGVLIDELLTFSKLGRKALVKSAVDMNEVVQMSIDDLNLHKRVIESIDVKKLSPSFVDRALMKQVIINLLSNAIKYSSRNEHAEIVISSRKEGNNSVYSISDNGVGFDMKYASNLFGVFQRMHSATDFEGTGVGLAIVQRIINRHDGKIWAESEIDHGATFSFSLPEMTIAS